jgi:3'-phosphoadenosine 5'-phosphosulfate sulfotransferase (PAPS reductase)/FAD synthetase
VSRNQREGFYCGKREGRHCRQWPVVKVLVPISGGKDSQTCLKLALQKYKPNEVRGLFCDTKFEHPMTYDHVEKLRMMYGNIRIDTVSGGSVLEKCEKYERFPGGGARHCTDELKIRETRIYAKRLAEKQGVGFEVWFGMRSEESGERERRYAGKVCDEVYAPHEVIPGKYPKYLAKLGVVFRLAILHWSKDDVFRFLAGQQNPLYEWFDRVGCFPCQAAGDKHKEKAYSFDDFGRKQFKLVKIVADKIGKPMFTSQGGQQRNNPNQMCLLACGE